MTLQDIGGKSCSRYVGARDTGGLLLFLGGAGALPSLELKARDTIEEATGYNVAPTHLRCSPVASWMFFA